MAKGTIGERIYRLLLRMYPRDFSDDYADEMTRLYRDRVRGEGAASVWVALVADLVRTAPREQAATLVQDVRHAWRTWARTPVLALTAILTLALGVGANTAVFSVVHGVLLRPLPYPDADRLVELFEHDRRADGRFFRVSLLNYLSWVERARSFDALATFSGRDFIVTEHGDPERIIGSAVTASLVQGARRRADRRATTDGRRRAARRATRGRARGVTLGTRVWPRSGGRRPLDHPERYSPPDCRRRADRVSRGRTHADRRGRRRANLRPADDEYGAEPRQPHAARGWAAAPAGVAGSGPGRNASPRRRHGGGIPGHESKLGRVDRAPARLDVRSSRPRVAPGPAWRGWRRAPHRLRERRQSAARARHEPSARIRAAHGARRAARPSGATTAHREHLAGDGQRRLWTHGGHLLDAGVAHADPGDDSTRR